MLADGLTERKIADILLPSRGRIERMKETEAAGTSPYVLNTTF
jgi:hypothetical protein